MKLFENETVLGAIAFVVVGFLIGMLWWWVVH